MEMNEMNGRKFPNGAGAEQHLVHRRCIFIPFFPVAPSSVFLWPKPGGRGRAEPPFMEPNDNARLNTALPSGHDVVVEGRAAHRSVAPLLHA